MEENKKLNISDVSVSYKPFDCVYLDRETNTILHQCKFLNKRNNPPSCGNMPFEEAHWSGAKICLLYEHDN